MRLIRHQGSKNIQESHQLYLNMVKDRHIKPQIKEGLIYFYYQTNKKIPSEFKLLIGQYKELTLQEVHSNQDQ